MKDVYEGKTIAVSGGFDPLHGGHLDMFEEAKKIVGPTGKLVVFVNSDDFLVQKKGKPFMSLSERMRIIAGLRVVDEVIAVIDTDNSVCQTLEKFRPDIFANGGDRNKENIPEDAICTKFDITMLFNIGGGKTQSSSVLLKNFLDASR